MDYIFEVGYSLYIIFSNIDPNGEARITNKATNIKNTTNVFLGVDRSRFI